ncbi:MAG: TonB-dependent receptor domain-containing protein, partial [Planctomycetota bacterium]
AARGVSLARVYDDLGFQQLGVNEASNSLTSDPANASAHRFLSDVYQGVRRRETARVSELLQAQMLQDINVNPVQPSISETNLNIIGSGGPAKAGFNEFNPLFERDRLQFNASGQVGNNDTLGGEGVLSGLFGPLSFSLGAFSFETDGFRDNNDIDHDIYSMFAQAAITPELNIQVEFRSRDSEEGDLALNFDPDQFLEESERTLDQDIARAGLRYSPTPNSDILVSYIYSDRQEDVSETRPIDFPPFGTLDFVADSAADEQGRQVEAQYLHRSDRFNVTAGFAHIDVDSEIMVTSTLGGDPFFSVDTEPDIEHPRGYIYANVNLPVPVTWTLGVGFDDYEEEDLQVEEVSPKFGVQWDVTSDVQLRGAVFQTVKPALVSNRTLEPTQIAGFNQFFDDTNATESTRYGVGLDWDVSADISVGAEATWRDLDEPLFSGGEVIIEDRDEELHRAYIYWTPFTEVALSAEVVYDLYETDETIEDDRPRKVETISVPIGVRYFHRSGLFAGAGATYVDQEVERSELSSLAGGTDDFIVVDAAIGWRIPNRLGIVSLEVRNLFDEEFNYQDDSFREFSDDPSTGPFIPERTVLGRLILSF